MKTPVYKSASIKIIQSITLLFGLHINLLIASTPVNDNPINHVPICITCSYSVVEIQKDALVNELTLLTPTTPAEATFSDEAAPIEINLAPTTPSDAPFDNDPEITTPSTLKDLAPKTPVEADYND